MTVLIAILGAMARTSALANLMAAGVLLLMKVLRDKAQYTRQ